jgi:NAD(P)-dependent dehydrogenase (short-subunit alcohol dehydrogenase family)
MAQARTAIVTGGGKRVGADIVAALVERGWTVLAMSGEAAIRFPPGPFGGCRAWRSRTARNESSRPPIRFPPVRLLVNNASRFHWDDLGEFSAEEFDAHMHVNVRAPILLTHGVGGERHEGGDSLIVNILDSKLAAPNPDFLSYTLVETGACRLYRARRPGARFQAEYGSTQSRRG